LRGAAAEFPNDAELLELEKRAQDGVKRNEEANRLITESQELFAQQKSAEAIQLLREAYELDKGNSLARSILANALVEHARSFVETDWLEAEKLTNQALRLNPAHPTAKTILSLIVEQKRNSPVEDWVSQARKLQSSRDLFAALAWVAEGLAVHPNDPKLLHIQDAIQRDQGAQRRQTRRRDMDDLRRMELEIDGAADAAAKQELATRIQTVAARYWTDGEFLSVANGLLQRLGLAAQAGSTKSSTASPHSKGATVIFHVPRSSAPKPALANTGGISVDPVPSKTLPQRSAAPPELPRGSVQSSTEVGTEAQRSVGLALLNDAPRGKVQATSPEAKSPPQTATISAAEVSAPAAEVISASSQTERPKRSSLTALILVCAATVIIAVAATLFLARKHYASPTASAPAVAPTVTTFNVSAPAQASPAMSPPAASAPSTPEPAPPALQPSSDADSGKVALRAPLASNNQVAKASRSGFPDPAQQAIHVRKGEEAGLAFNLRPQPQPRLASLNIQDGVPGTTVFVDQTLAGTIQPDGMLSVSTINPGDHIVELRKERFRPRQFKEHFIAGGAISLHAADTALEAAPGELKISFTPADAKVAIVKGERLILVSSGVPLNLAAGSYTLTARTPDGFRSSSTLEIVAGQSRTLDLSLAPNDMSKWDDPGAWKHERDSFIRKGGNFVLYRVAPASGTFAFSAMPAKGHLLQWVVNYTDSKNYVLCQMDENNFHRTVIRKGQKAEEVIVPDKGDKKSFRALHIRVSPTEIVHQIRHGDSWTILDRWTQPGADLSLGKFGFYIPGDDEVVLSNFAHYAELNIR
jgi:hypothetical protein